MSGTGVLAGAPAARLHRPGRAARAAVAVIIAVVVVVASIAILSYAGSNPQALVVYTYPSLLGGNCGQGGAIGPLLSDFTNETGVAVRVECPAGDLVGALQDQPGADVVIGLDELTAPLAEAAGLLVPYVPARIADVPRDLVGEISPGGYVTPYEYGYLAIDYNATFAASTGGAIASSSFPDFAANRSWASQLLYEDPTIDITGEEFLAWEVEFYQYVLHQSDWTGFWKAVLPYARSAPDWGTAWGEFTTPPNNPSLVVSYTTDPASASYYGGAGAFNATVSTWNGTLYGWKTIYGAGIVKGTSHLGADEELVDFLLGGSFQSQIPLNEWEYPANTTIALPPIYSANLPPSSIVALNDYTSPSALAAALPGWQSTWQALANG